MVFPTRIAGARPLLRFDAESLECPRGRNMFGIELQCPAKILDRGDSVAGSHEWAMNQKKVCIPRRGIAARWLE